MVKEKVDQGVIMKTLDWAYDKSVNGISGFDSAIELGDNYLKDNNSKIDAANSLVRWQNTKAVTSGFITGLGGIIVLPIAIPANLATVMYVQIRMITAIAHIGGYDVKDDKVKSLVYACMTGSAAADIMKDIGIKIGTKLSESLIRNISSKTIVAINQKVGFRLLTKFGEKGIINFGKSIPLLGGVVGGTFDGITTNIIGNISITAFIGK
jgi:hypothetical protein